jgi:hypothetical protein
MERRTMLGAALAGLVAFLRPRPAVASDSLHEQMGRLQLVLGGQITRTTGLSQIGLDHAELEQQILAEEAAEQQRLQDQQETANELVFLVHGGTLPKQHNTVIRPVLGRVDGGDGPNDTPQAAVFEQSPQCPPGQYPHSPRFRVVCVAEIGTVDELTERFRQGLLRAKRATEAEFALQNRDKEQIQQHLQAVRAASEQVHGNNGGPAFLSWDMDYLTGQYDLCADAEKQRAEIARQQAELEANKKG